MSKTKHPLAGETRRIHTGHTLLRGRNILIVDWFEHYTGTDKDNLKAQFAHRCAQTSSHPVSVKMDWFFDQHCIVGLLDGDATMPLLVDRDEILDLRERMKDRHENYLHCVQIRARGVLERMTNLVRWHQSSQLYQRMGPLLPVAEAIVTLLADEELIYSAEGIERISVAHQRARHLLAEMEFITRLAREQGHAAIRDYHSRAIVMKHCDFHHWVGDEAPSCNSTSAEMSLGDIKQLTYGPNSQPLPPVISELVIELEDFYVEAKARFDALYAWQTGEPATGPHI